MTAGQHRPSCAARQRKQAQASGWSVERTVEAVAQCCSVSLLRAQRLARGWTLNDTADRLRALALDQPAGPRADADQLRLWETHPTRRPQARTIDLLCRLYETDAQHLGLTGDYRADAPEPTSVAQRHPVLAHRVPLQGQLVGRDEDPLDRLIDGARRAVDRTLASASVSAGQLDLLDQRLLWHRRRYMTTEPRPMLELLLSDLAEVHELAAERQPAAVQARLSEMTAILATLVADALMKLGRLRQAHAWYGTARTAADDSGHPVLRARVRVQAAMLPYYYGPLDDAVELAREARHITRGRPSPTAAFAAAAEARALAQRGDAAGTAQAIHHARQLLEHCDGGDEQDAWAFPYRRLLLYLSGAHTALGQIRQARDAQREALALYPDHTGIDPALLHLEAAICLALERSPSEACQLAATTYLQVPSGHRTPILSARARHVIDAIPPAMRNARPVRELGEILALPPSAV
jgi:tetratricopeptide (TPR) repeat protein